MKLSYLKKIRIIVSLFFLTLTAFLFLDFRNIFPEKFINGVLYLQFVPSLLKFLNLISLTAAGFLIILVLTFLFGRVYCSTICPLGIFQDVISYISRKLKNKKYYHFSKAWNILRYSLLILTLLFFLGGSLFLITLLDPYSNFGRIFTYLLKPGVVEINNVSTRILESLNIYFLFPVDLKEIRFELLIFPLLFLALVTWMALVNGRIYCNTVCPVGTLLGFFSKFSIFKIIIDPETCTSCGLCDRVCKASCMNFAEPEVDFSRCVACFNCLKVCPASAVKYKVSFSKVKELKIPGKNVLEFLKKKKAKEIEADLSKRKFILSSLAYTFGSLGLAFGQNAIKTAKDSTVPEEKENPVSPPGSGSIENFTDFCTACALCVSACPTHVLQPSFLEYGLLGIMQPRMDYHSGFCNYECIICSGICPTGAILPILPEEKKTAQLGISKFIKENCIVHTEKTDCGACAEQCPTKACHMVPYEENLVIPEVNEDTCTGCGACEYACPTVPYKAIYIDGIPVHLAAQKPEIEEIDTEIDYEEDFPF